ncbi:MAG TPA: GNAT family N-acetyltransferase, partial [Roseiflexaceae bacterium]|nr:GNAT family N-acetyltransferase [Roseiflexaceae bacterium]
ERLDAMLAGARAPMPLEGAFFATRQGEPVGAVCTFFQHTTHGVAPELGWLVVAPQHRGRRLARALCLALLAYVGSAGYDYCYLKTEDFRRAAIATYLEVGFEPEILDDTQPARWALLVSEMNSRRARNSASLDTPAG